MWEDGGAQKQRSHQATTDDKNKKSKRPTHRDRAHYSIDPDAWAPSVDAS